MMIWVVQYTYDARSIPAHSSVLDRVSEGPDWLDNDLYLVPIHQGLPLIFGTRAAHTARSTRHDDRPPSQGRTLR